MMATDAVYTTGYSSYPSDRQPVHWQSVRTNWPDTNLPEGLQLNDYSKSSPPSLNASVPQSSQHTAGSMESQQFTETEVPRSRSRLGLTARTPPMSLGNGHIPDKRNISVATLHNERYVLDAASIKEHENEDDFLIHPNPYNLCLCVFDGHDGRNAVRFTSKYLKTRVFDTRSWVEISKTDQQNVMESALVEFIRVTDADFFKDINHYIAEKRRIQLQIPPGMKSYQAQMTFPTQVARLQELEKHISGGCTAVVAILTEKRLYVANLGDSRAILACQASSGALNVKQLSEDHGVENEQEIQRLAAIGLDPEQLKRTGRLGTQENTRSIGDYSIKGGYKDVDVICHATCEPGLAVPHVMSVPVGDPFFKYLILMSDGVYKTVEAVAGLSSNTGNDILVGIIDQHVERNGFNNNSTAMEILKKIRHIQHDLFQKSACQDPHSEIAIANRKRDDMTLLIYKFH